MKDCASYYHIHKHTFQGLNKVLIYKVLRICIKVDLQNFKNKLSFLSSQAGWKEERKEKWRILCNLLGELAIKDGVGSAMDHISCNKWVYSPVDTGTSLHPAHSNRITSLSWNAAASIICHMFSYCVEFWYKHLLWVMVTKWHLFIFNDFFSGEDIWSELKQSVKSVKSSVKSVLEKVGIVIFLCCK